MSTGSTPAEKSDDCPAHSGSPESQRGTENNVGVTHERLTPADNREPAQTYPNCSRLTTRPADHAITAKTTRPSSRDASLSSRRRSKTGRSASSPSKRKRVVAKPQVSSSPSPGRELSSRKTKRKSGIDRSLMATVNPESQAAVRANSSTHAKPHKLNHATNAAARQASEGKFQPNRITSEDTAGTTSADIDTYAAATTSVETQEKTSKRLERKAKAGVHSKAKRSKAIEAKAVVAKAVESMRDAGHGSNGSEPMTFTPSKVRRKKKTWLEGRFFKMADPGLRPTRASLTPKDQATTLKTGSALHTFEDDEELSTLQNLRYHVMWIVALSGLLMVFVVLLVSLREGARTPVSPACGTPACVAYSKVLEGVLNYSVDPCDDMDAFVCSKGAGYHTGGWLTPPSLVAHAIRRYQLQMVDLFLSGNTKFTASKIVTDFLLECTSTYKTPQGLDSFIDIFDLVPVPWPFEYSSAPELHPLEAALTLSIKFGVDTWFRAYISNSKQPASGSNTTLALFIESCAKPSLWLSFLHAMGDRRKLYFEELHRLYNATLPDNAHRDSLLATEKGVLSILHNARTQGPPAGPAVASIAKIAAFVNNSTLSNWLEAMTASPGGHLADEKTLVALDDVRILRAVNALLSTYSVDALSKHLSWWLVQILTIIGWSRGFYVIAGSRAAAAAGAFVECYSFAASKFGLLIASESAVSLFTPEVRKEVESFFKELTTVLTNAVDGTPWLSNDTKSAILGRLNELEICVWPPDVEHSGGVLWQLYSDFCVTCDPGGSNATAELPTSTASVVTSTPQPALLEYWSHASAMLWRRTSEQYEDMQVLWQGDALEAIRYEPLNNRLLVSHAALQSPFYHPGGAELLHANFAGLGATFLAHVLRMLMPPDPTLDEGTIPARWTDLDGLVRQAGDLQCDRDFIANFADVVALGFAWQALKKAVANFNLAQHRNVLPSIPTPDTSLVIRDTDGSEHLYTGDQLFFLTYCLSRCGENGHTGVHPPGSDCNTAVRNVRGFAGAFDCKPGSPMAPLVACDVTELF